MHADTPTVMPPVASQQEEEVEQLVQDAHGTLELDLSCRQLQQVPSSLGTCASLTALSLSANCLVEFPTAVCSLQHLLSLDVSYNQLTHLPAQLGGLTRLQLLNAAYNHLTTLPQQVTCLEGLQELRLNDNQITHLPAGLLQLPSLQLLHVQYNHLNHLPTGRPASLTDFSFEGNPLRPAGASRPSTAAPDGSRPASSSSCTSGAGAAGLQQLQPHASTSKAMLTGQHALPHGSQHAPDVLILDDGGGDAAGDSRGGRGGRRRGGALTSPNRVAPAEPGAWQQASADEFLDLDGPGIDLVGLELVSPRQGGGAGAGPDGAGAGDAPQQAMLVQQAMDELAELPPACAAVLYRSMDAVQAGLQEVQAGRPLTRGGTAPGTGMRPGTTSRAPGTAGSGGRHRPGSATVRPASSLAPPARPVTGGDAAAPHWLPTSSATTPTGVHALLAGPPRPTTASPGAGARPGSATGRPPAMHHTPGSSLAGGVGGGGAGGDGAGGGFQGLPVVTFPFTAGVRSMMRQLSGNSGSSKAPAAATASANAGPAQGASAGQGVAGTAGRLQPHGSVGSSGSGNGGYDAQGGLRARPQAVGKVMGSCEGGGGENDGADDALRTVRLLLASRNPALLQGLDQAIDGDDDEEA